MFVNANLNTINKQPPMSGAKKLPDYIRENLKLLKQALEWNADIIEVEPMLPCGDAVIDWDSYFDSCLYLDERKYFVKVDGRYELRECCSMISLLDCDVDRDNGSLLKVFVGVPIPLQVGVDEKEFVSWHEAHEYSGIPNAILEAYYYMEPLLNLPKKSKLTALAIALERFVFQSDLEVNGSVDKGVIALIEHTLSEDRLSDCLYFNVLSNMIDF